MKRIFLNIHLCVHIIGHGAVYKYDAVGSVERVRAACSGTGASLIQPMLDTITGMEGRTSPLSMELNET